MLGPHGLVVFDAADPAAKPLAADLFAREIATPGASTTLARDTGDRLREAGFHAQVDPPANGVALFLRNGSRLAIRIDGDRLRAGDDAMDRSAWLARVRADATRFSPNVLLRPIVQDRLFPTVCYVAGPNELAYLAQLKPVYGHFEVPMPLVAPRLSATLVDPAVMKFLRRTGLALGNLQPRDESALNRLLGAQLPPAVEQALEAAGGAVRERMAAVAGAVAEVDPTLAGAAESTRGRMERDLGNLQGKVVQAAKRRHPDAEAPVHPGPVPDLPPREPTGARRRRHLLPEPVRPPPRGPAALRRDPRHPPPLGHHGLRLRGPARQDGRGPRGGAGPALTSSGRPERSPLRDLAVAFGVSRAKQPRLRLAGMRSGMLSPPYSPDATGR